VIPVLKGKYGKITNLNTLNNYIFKSNLFPDIAYYTNGLCLSTDYKIISTEKVKEIVFKRSKKVVFKIDNSQQGKGVYFFDKTNFETKKIALLGNGVVQDFINQHNFFKEIIPNSVATIRITTVMDNNGNASARACYLSLGREIVTHVKSDTNIKIPVDLKTGKISEQGYLVDWNIIDRHPDTNIVFANKQIPHFDKCVTTAVELQKLIPFVRSIGWDMIIDENNNIKIMEWNGNHNGIKFSEATQGPTFADLGWENLWKI